MTKEELADYISHGHEIDFKYKNKWYGINYELTKDDRLFISFYEGHNELSEHLVKTVDALVDIRYKGVTVMEMLEALGDEEEAEKLGDLRIW
ncbi:MAG: hypothetical protein IJ566_07425 [Cardiobacteriaceae bacterium]|nr:hypothetical protein [Cardiobacteriaceae bacterium]